MNFDWAHSPQASILGRFEASERKRSSTDYTSLSYGFSLFRFLFDRLINFLLGIEGGKNEALPVHASQGHGKG